MKEEKLKTAEIKEGAPFAALSYVSLLWILTFIFKKDNEFAHFHARQGIVIFLGEVVFACLSLIPLIGILFYIFGLILFVFVSLYGIYLALTGKMTPIPLVKEVAEKLVV